jgi:hypothetical protein
LGDLVEKGCPGSLKSSLVVGLREEAECGATPESSIQTTNTSVLRNRTPVRPDDYLLSRRNDEIGRETKLARGG